MKLFRAIWNWLNGLTRKPTPDIPSGVINRSVETNFKHVGLVIGHNSAAQGATNYEGESEYSYYKRIAPLLQSELRKEGIDCSILERSTGRYSRQVSEVANNLVTLKCDLAICLHFNSYNKNVQGVETLRMRTAGDFTYHLASILSRYIHTEYGFALRASKGVKNLGNKDRGAGMLEGIRKKDVPAVLIEPFFGDNKECLAVLNDDTRFVNTLKEAIMEAIGEGAN